MENCQIDTVYYGHVSLSVDLGHTDIPWWHQLQILGYNVMLEH